jgi:hypothetical protein
MFMIFAFECQAGFFAEQRNKSYKRYDVVSSAGKNPDLTPKAPFGNRLCRLAERSGA